ncbi:hypothetical protein DLAC_09922 [Tieghemostelium lacteum]|uniref:Ankyrin repeat-containing protein n=1 Tax=Tieghemostelium lacteum TaxID=361077 RepID=A0A151Z5N1_TIELA|nr:hypothetical protein DLAC_09922 [Tieghemostelium lacteum]|eukprot:KYQ89263.1 hypothetical protein DLAC_09922 [Tieghemostelium lacteum]
MDKLFFEVYRNKFLKNLIFTYIKKVDNRIFWTSRGHSPYSVHTWGSLHLRANTVVDNGWWHLLVDRLELDPLFSVSYENIWQFMISNSDYRLFRRLYDRIPQFIKQIQRYFIHAQIRTKSRYSNLIKVNHTLPRFKNYLVDKCCDLKDNFEIIEFLISKGYLYSVKALENSLKSGNIRAVRFFYPIYQRAFKMNLCSSTIKVIVMNGHLDILQYLNEEMHAIPTRIQTPLIYHAILNNNFEMVKYLGDNKIGTVYNPNEDREEIIPFDPENKPPKKVTLMDLAAKVGDSRIFFYLRDNLNQRFTFESVANLCMHGGHLEAVKWIYQQKPSYFTTSALAMACQNPNGNSICQFLIEQDLKSKLFTRKEFMKSITNVSVDTLSWLLTNKIVSFTTKKFINTYIENDIDWNEPIANWETEQPSAWGTDEWDQNETPIWGTNDIPHDTTIDSINSNINDEDEVYQDITSNVNEEEEVKEEVKEEEEEYPTIESEIVFAEWEQSSINEFIDKLVLECDLPKIKMFLESDLAKSTDKIRDVTLFREFDINLFERQLKNDSEKEFIEIYKYIIAYGIKVNNEYLVFHCVDCNWPNLLSLVLKEIRSNSVSMKPEINYKVLCGCIQRRDTGILELLLKNLDLITKYKKSNNHYSSRRSEDTNLQISVEVFQYLCEKKIDLSDYGIHLQTSLLKESVAVQPRLCYNHREFIRYLIDNQIVHSHIRGFVTNFIINNDLQTVNYIYENYAKFSVDLPKSFANFLKQHVASSVGLAFLFKNNLIDKYNLKPLLKNSNFNMESVKILYYNAHEKFQELREYLVETALTSRADSIVDFLISQGQVPREVIERLIGEAEKVRCPSKQKIDFYKKHLNRSSTLYLSCKPLRESNDDDYLPENLQDTLLDSKSQKFRKKYYNNKDVNTVLQSGDYY